MATLLDKWKFVVAMSMDRTLSRSDLACGVQLLEAYNQSHGFAWPSLETLAARIGVHRATVIASTQRLQAQGYFQIVSGGGRRRSNRYKPNFGIVERKSSFPTEREASASDLGRVSTEERIASSRQESSYENPVKNPSWPDEGTARGTRLPEDVALPEEWLSWALREGHPEPAVEFDRFRDYWIAQPGQKGRKTNWFATWRNWVRRSLNNWGKKRHGKATRGVTAAAAILGIDIE